MSVANRAGGSAGGLARGAAVNVQVKEASLGPRVEDDGGITAQSRGGQKGQARAACVAGLRNVKGITVKGERSGVS